MLSENWLVMNKPERITGVEHENDIGTGPPVEDRRQTPDDRPEKMDDNTVKAEPSDDAIIERIRNGDMNAFELLMRRYNRWVFGIAAKRVAHD